MVFLGIDGCRGGWCATCINDDKTSFLFAPQIDQLIASFEEIGSALIDIPIGLSSKSVKRDIDQFARKTLGPGKTSSIFSPPLREALTATSYAEACLINAKLSGKKISIQSWNISDKILEVDKLLSNHPDFRMVIHESHPEICFKFLNFGNSLKHKKKAKDNLGIEERLRILSKFHPESRAAFESQKQILDRKIAQPDDLVDALCLAVTSKLGFEYGYHIISGASKKDDKNIDMYMYYFDPRLHEIAQ